MKKFIFSALFIYLISFSSASASVIPSWDVCLTPQGATYYAGMCPTWQSYVFSLDFQSGNLRAFDNGPGVVTNEVYDGQTYRNMSYLIGFLECAPDDYICYSSGSLTYSNYISGIGYVDNVLASALWLETGVDNPTIQTSVGRYAVYRSNLYQPVAAIGSKIRIFKPTVSGYVESDNLCIDDTGLISLAEGSAGSWSCFFEIPDYLTKRVSGNVRDLLSVAVPGVEIILTDGLGNIKKAYTGSDGQYLFNGVFAGIYSITAVLANYSFQLSVLIITKVDGVSSTGNDFVAIIDKKGVGMTGGLHHNAGYKHRLFNNHLVGAYERRY